MPKLSEAALGLSIGATAFSAAAEVVEPRLGYFCTTIGILGIIGSLVAMRLGY